MYILFLVQKMKRVKQIARGSWSGFGKVTVGIDPNTFEVLNGHPTKIPTDEILGGVVQNCPKYLSTERKWLETAETTKSLNTERNCLKTGEKQQNFLLAKKNVTNRGHRMTQGSLIAESVWKQGNDKIP